VLRSNTGLTLVEVIVALVIALLVFLALMQTALIGIGVNMGNALRDEAVGISEMRLEAMRNIPYTSVVSDTGSPSSNYDSNRTGCNSGCNDCPTGFSTGWCWCRGVKNISEFKFCTSMVCTEFGGDGNCATSDADNKQVAMRVGWKWKGENYTHSVTTVRKR
jgi:hypothetical protein